MKHKWCIWLLVLILVCSLTGCFKKTAPETPAPAPNTPAPSADVSEAPSAPAPAPSPSPEADPTLTVVITNDERTYYAEDGTALMLCSVDTPTFSGGNDDAAAAIADTYNTVSLPAYESSTELLAEDAEFFYESGEFYGEWMPYASDRSISVERSDADALSIVTSDYVYAGGAHGSGIIRGYTFHAATGTLLTLDTLSAGETDICTFIYDAALDYLEQNDMIEWLFEDYADTLALLIEDGGWYLSEAGFVLICNTYDIAPYAAGPILITVPYADLDGVIRPEYIPAV